MNAARRKQKTPFHALFSSASHLRYFKDVVALVVGEAVLAPALVRVREASPTPRSRDARFYEHWTSDPKPVPVEQVAAQWPETPQAGNEGAPS